MPVEPEGPPGPPDWILEFGPITLELWAIADTLERTSVWGYRFWDYAWGAMYTTPVFENYHYEIDSRVEAFEAALDLVEFLTVTEDEEESSYFYDYTDRQRDWLEERAKEVGERFRTARAEPWSEAFRFMEWRPGTPSPFRGSEGPGQKFWRPRREV